MADTTPVASAPAANRVIVWTTASDLYSMSDAQLAAWHQDGIGGFVASVQWLPGMGGAETFNSDGTRPAGGVEALLANSEIVARAHALGMKLYLGFNLVNYFNTQTPLADWFDEAAWNTVVNPAVAGVAGAARELGFDGIAMDGELYQQKGNVQTATWSWDYPGNTHTEQQVRTEVKLRGQQLMATILAAFPDVQIADYAASFPDTWDAYIRDQNGDGPNTFSSNVDINFWDGMTSVEGYSAIRFYDETFYKDTGLASATTQTWTSALEYQENSLFALFSQDFSNWSYAADRVYWSPSAWIDGDITNEGTWTAPRTPSYVATQLEIFTDWGMGGELADFAYAPISQFDYSGYVRALQAVASAGPVDDPGPNLTIGAVEAAGNSVTITGSATDTYAVRVIRWSTLDGASGTAQVVWATSSGSYNRGYGSQSDWTASGIPLAAAASSLTISAENIHGVTSTVTAQLPPTTAAPTSTPPTSTAPTSTPPISTPPTGDTGSTNTPSASTTFGGQVTAAVSGTADAGTASTSASGATSSLAGVSSSAPSNVAYAINAGGPAIFGTLPWLADTPQSLSTYSNDISSNNNHTWSTAATINTSQSPGVPPSVFQTERFDFSSNHSDLTWVFPVASGKQATVDLDFAEIYPPLFKAGGRVFNVYINGTEVLKNFDIYATAGGGDTGIVRSFNVTSTGTVTITFGHVTQEPEIQGIEILTN